MDTCSFIGNCAGGWMPLRMARKRRTVPLMPHGTSEICPWMFMQYLINGSCYGSWNLSSKCLPYPHLQLGRNEKSVQSRFHACSAMTEEPRVFLPPTTCSIGEMKAVHSWITF
jgi:hypothetical protein